MVGVLGLLVIGLVTAKAIAGRAPVDIVFVAGLASLGCMQADEREECGVAERDPPEARIRRPMTCVTGGWEAGGSMVRILRLLVILEVTGVAADSDSLEDLPDMA